MKRLSGGLLLVSFVIIASVCAFSEDKTWVGTTTKWDKASNWDPPGTPTSTDNVIIPVSVVYPTISSVTVNNLTVLEGAYVIVKGDLTVTGVAIIEGTLTDQGNFVTFTFGSVNVTPTGTFISTRRTDVVILNGDSVIDGSFIQSQDSQAYINGDVTFSGSGTLQLGNVTIASGQTVTVDVPTFIVNNSLVVNGDLTVTGDLINGGIAATTTINVSGGSLSVGGDLLQVSGTGDVSVTNGTISVGGNLSVNDDLFVNTGSTLTVAGNTTITDDASISGSFISMGTDSTLTLAGGVNSSLLVASTGVLDFAHPVDLGAASFTAYGGSAIYLTGEFATTGSVQLLGTGSGYTSDPSGYVQFFPSANSPDTDGYYLNIGTTGDQPVTMEYVSFSGLDTLSGGVNINDDIGGDELMDYVMFSDPSTTGAGSSYITFGTKIDGSLDHWADGTAHISDVMVITDPPAPEYFIARDSTGGVIAIDGYLIGEGIGLLPIEGDSTTIGEEPVPTAVFGFKTRWEFSGDDPIIVTARWQSALNLSGFRIDAHEQSIGWHPLHTGLLGGVPRPDRGSEFSFRFNSAVRYDSIRVMEIERNGTERVLDQWSRPGASFAEFKSQTLPVLKSGATDSIPFNRPPQRIDVIRRDPAPVSNAQFTGEGYRIDAPPAGLIRIDASVIPGLNVENDGTLRIDSYTEWFATRRGQILKPVMVDAFADAAWFFIEPPVVSDEFDSTGGPLWIGDFTVPTPVKPEPDCWLVTDTSAETLWFPDPSSSGLLFGYRSIASISDDVEYYSLPGARNLGPAWYLDPASAFLTVGVAGEFILNLNSPAPGDTPPVLRIGLAGDSYSDASPDHRLRVSLNGKILGVLEFDGVDYFAFDIELSDTDIIDGDNALTLEPIGNALFGVIRDDVWLDRIDILYNSTAPVPDGGLTTRLTLSATGDRIWAVDLSYSAAYLFDVTDPAAPVRLSASMSQTDGGLWRAKTLLTPGDCRIAVIYESDINIASAAMAVTIETRTIISGGWLAVGGEPARSALEPLLAKRRTTAMSAEFLSLSEAYDRYGYGVASAGAIKRALEDIRPRAVAFVGPSSVDPYNHWNAPTPLNPLPLIPLDYVVTQPAGRTPSDLSFADWSNDRLPDAAVGRISATNLSELENYVSRITGVQPSARAQIVLVSDADDDANSVSFESFNDDILPPEDISVDRFSLETQSAADVISALSSSALSEPLAVAYQGHGAADQWSAETPELTADTLASGWRRPVAVISGSCLTGSHQYPDDCMAESFIVRAGSGASAVFAPSAFGDAAAQHIWVKPLTERIATEAGLTAGDAWIRAIADLKSDSNPASKTLAASLILFGDPDVTIGENDSANDPTVNRTFTSDSCAQRPQRNPLPAPRRFALMLVILFGLGCFRQRRGC